LRQLIAEIAHGGPKQIQLLCSEDGWGELTHHSTSFAVRASRRAARAILRGRKIRELLLLIVFPA
jgi:hypothetical protein